MRQELEPTVRRTRILFGFVGAIFAVLGVVLCLVPAPNMPYGAAICAAVGIGLIAFAIFAPARVVAWFGELIAVLP